MIAADIMTENVRFIRPEETISDAVELLQTLEVRHLPVVNEDDELVGMLSDRDLRSLFVPFDEDGETAGSVLTQGRMTVAKIMSSNVSAVDAEDTVADVVDRLLEDKVGALPVVDHDNKLVGIISYVDVLRNWQEERPDGAPARGEGSAKPPKSAAASARGVQVKRKASPSSGKKVAIAKSAKGAAKKPAAKAAPKKPAVKAAPKKAAAKAAPKKAAPKKAAKGSVGKAKKSSRKG